jgi:hypothetical protein
MTRWTHEGEMWLLNAQLGLSKAPRASAHAWAKSQVAKPAGGVYPLLSSSLTYPVANLNKSTESIPFQI